MQKPSRRNPRWFSYARKELTIMSDAERLGEGVGFERIRRITGYLVGTMEKWNNAKRAEESDRVKHGLGRSVTV
ncbi:MAG: hypothetical protein IJT94_12080 [Oscillibacter sp.]|nr:hypothetical protein [Oscillibacter sp.]